jgi:hypothetical protein
MAGDSQVIGAHFSFLFADHACRRRISGSVRWSPSAWVIDLAQMLPEEKLGAPPREAMYAARP